LEREVSELQAAGEKTRLFNIRLQKEILNLEAIVVSSKLEFDRLEFEERDLTGLVRNFVSDVDDLVKEKMATILIEPLPTLKVSPVLIRSLFQHLIRNALFNT